MRQNIVNTMIALSATLVTGALVARGDVITEWNQLGSEAAATAGGNTGTGANGYTRTLTISSLAVNDAVASVTGGHAAYLGTVPYSGPADVNAAAAQAAFTVLNAAFPSQSAKFQSALNADLAGIPNGAAKTNGINVGTVAANNIIAARANDGSNATSPAYTGGTGIGQWRPTPGTYGVGGTNTFAPFDNTNGSQPFWANVAPFALHSNWKTEAAFQVPAPPSVGSAAYNAALAKTQNLGAANSTVRTADQTQIAEFWYPASTITWNDIARTVILGKNLSIDEEARDLSLINLALADSRIGAWNTKYADGFWRPITAIHDGTDPNQDASWQPLLPTPNHPSYISGHGTSGGAAGEVLIDLFGDNNSFTIASPSAWLPTAGITRSFTSFSQAEAENNDSRIYAGIHFDFDQAAGTALGSNIGDFVVANSLPVPEPGGLGIAGLAGVALLRRQRRSVGR